jgi:hypothetical protein
MGTAGSIFTFDFVSVFGFFIMTFLSGGRGTISSVGDGSDIFL